MKIKPLIIQNPSGAIKITSKELLDFGIPQSALDAGKMHGELKTWGVWGIPISFRALVMSAVWDDSKGYTVAKNTTIYGLRTMGKLKQNGHAMDGWLSIGGKKLTGFTSSQLFEIEGGKLIDVAIIHARLNKTK